MEDRYTDMVLEITAEYGHSPHIAGETVASEDNEITIRSCFLKGTKRELSSLRPYEF